MARKLFDTGIFNALTASGGFGVGATIAFYTAGTATPITTYNAASAGSANANPVVADANGRFDEIWIDSGQSIKYAFTAYPGAVVVTVDNLSIDAATPVTIAAGLLDFVAGTVPLPVANGGTGATTAAAARTNLGVAAPGAITGSGFTMTTARLLGRSTASTGAIEEITVGAGLLLSAGALTATGGGGGGTIADLGGLAVTSLTFGTNTIAAVFTAPNGDTLRVQGGVGSLGANLTGSITFPVAFSVAPVVVLTGGPPSTSSEGDVHTTSAASTTAVSIVNSGNATGSYHWLAVGKG